MKELPRVLVFGAWDDGPGYPRTRSLLQAFAAAGHAPHLWRLPSPLRGASRADLVRRPWRWPELGCRLLAGRRRARTELRVALGAVAPDVIVVPYPGHALVSVVRGLFAGRIVLDLFLPAYDTAVEDRRLFAAGSWPARALLALDRRACQSADLVLLDTPSHAARVAEVCALPVTRFAWLPVGDPDAPPAALPYAAPRPGTPLRVLFFGTGVPLHGLMFLVHAVQRCAGAVHLDVIGGSSRERRAIAALVSPHIELGPRFVSRRQLDAALARAHLVAGVFGTTGKTQRVVPFKVVHGLAAGRPVLTGDTEAVRAWLQPGTDVLTAPVGDVAALTRALLEAVASAPTLPRIASAARRTYEQKFSPAALAALVPALLVPTAAVPAESLVAADA